MVIGDAIIADARLSYTISQFLRSALATLYLLRPVFRTISRLCQ
jgi:hypothetical protein